jgi:hypothetical protein
VILSRDTAMARLLIVRAHSENIRNQPGHFANINQLTSKADSSQPSQWRVCTPLRLSHGNIPTLFHLELTIFHVPLRELDF